MKRLLMISALFMLFLAGCSADAEQGASDAETLYKNKCLVCHGADLTGASAPAVVKMGEKYSEEEALTIIKDGVRMMPGNLLSEEEAQTVTEWLMEQ